ncbi:hypothetical protein ACHWQZ_G002284 [Mnemiopsis leidyi]
MDRSLLFHIIAAVYHLYILVYPYYYKLDMRHAKGFGGRLKFLTIWGHLIQVCYYIFAALVDLRNWCCGNSCSKLRRARDWSFSTIVFPITFLVFILFWGLFAIDRELVMPRSLDNVIDPTYNHMVHTYIVFWPIVEALVTQISVPQKRQGLIAIAIFSVSYTVWSYIIFLNTGEWVYPILNILSDVQRVLFILVAYVLVVCLFLTTRAYQKKFGRVRVGMKTE